MTESIGNTDDNLMPAAEPRPGRFTRARLAFRHFRRTRPFWGSLLLVASAYFIAFPLLGGGFTFVTTVGARALAPLLIGGGILAAGAVAFCAPSQRHFPGIAAAMLAVVSLPLANLGGWLIGMVLGIIGASMVFGWAPYTDKQLAKFAARDERRIARRAAKRARHAGAIAA